jgi:translation initiation factor IF-1
LSKEDAIEVMAVVVETLPNAMFKVELENKHQALAHVFRTYAQKLHPHPPGDRVAIELSRTTSTAAALSTMLQVGIASEPIPFHRGTQALWFLGSNASSFAFEIGQACLDIHVACRSGFSPEICPANTGSTLQ